MRRRKPRLGVSSSALDPRSVMKAAVRVSVDLRLAAFHSTKQVVVVGCSVKSGKVLASWQQIDHHGDHARFRFTTEFGTALQ